ncbi:WDR20 family protein [Megaselia abdita]
MAVQLDPNLKDDLKTQFITREGVYRLMTLSEYSRPNRVGYTNTQSSPQVRVSIVTLPIGGGAGAGQQTTNSPVVNGNGGGDFTTTDSTASRYQQSFGAGPSLSIDSRLGGNGNGNNGCGGGDGPVVGGDRICFNFGKELYVYAFRGVKKGTELSKPIDKKLYKGTNPSCHDFNLTTATPDGAPLLVGFTTGQIQLVQPGRRESGKLYNEERLIDKTKVTCLKWLPGSANQFLASHASGHLYLYNEELACSPTAPNYQPFKMGDGYTILTCKSKSTRNPLYKWMFSTDNCGINEFAFSPCGTNLAIVSQDGFLRVFHYDTMELLGIARSYFGGFLCVCWSPDGKYIVVGGEDDLVTVWSFYERRVVARGQGHRSWVSVVAFDPYTTSYTNWDGPDFSDDENPISDFSNHHNHINVHDINGIDNKSPNLSNRPTSSNFRDSFSQATSYRLGSVSQDTQLCLWDITEDVLRHPLPLRHRLNSSAASGPTLANGDIPNNEIKVIKPVMQNSNSCNSSSNSKNNSSCNSNSSKFSTANCTISSMSSGLNDAGGGTTGQGTGTMGKSSSNATSNLIKLTNCISVTKSDSVDGALGVNGGAPPTTSSGFSALNSLTQRLSNFSFSSDKKTTNSSENHNHSSHNHQSRSNHRKAFSLSKSTGQHAAATTTTTSSVINASLSSTPNNVDRSSSAAAALIPSYDPIKLIGTPSCPRFDECPLLEPLVCKKIAHERLTALIFREDCFLTACQDGFIYTWARPGFSIDNPF